MARQIAAVTGRPLRRRFRRPSGNYIRDLFAQKEEDERRQREFEATQQFRKQQLDLAEEAYEHGKERDIRGTAIAGLTLGTQGLLALERSRAADRLYGRDYTTPETTTTGTDVPWYEDAYTGISENYMPILLSGAGGAATAQAAKKPWQKALIGGGTSGLMAYLGSGGNPYATGSAAALGAGGALAIDLLL